MDFFAPWGSIKSTLWPPSRKNKLFQICKLLESYINVYRKSSAKRKCHDENVILKVDRALNEIEFPFLFEIKKKFSNFQNM